MAREIQVKYSCDCGGYHSYKSGETYDPIGWLSAIETTDIDGHLEIKIMKVEDMLPQQAENPHNKFFTDIGCLTRWLQNTLFPFEPTPPVEPVPAVAEKPITDDDVPF